MPVHPVKGGYRWGNSGKVYKTKAAAERQARAIYASGWRGDTARARRTRRELAKLLSASRKAEVRYARDLVSAMREVTKGIENAVGEHHQPAHPDLRRDAQKLPKDLEDRVARHLRGRVGVAFDRMSETVNAAGERSSRLLGIDPKAMGLGGVVSNARNENLRLIEKAGRRYATQVREVLEDPKNEGLRVEELGALIAERGHVASSHADFIARDQTLKLNAALAEHRATAAGVERYEWSTSRDERVRPMHRELEGRSFRYDDPPVTNDDGDTNNPGEDYGCRCVAIPIVGETEEEPEKPELEAAE